MLLGYKIQSLKKKIPKHITIIPGIVLAID